MRKNLPTPVPAEVIEHVLWQLGDYDFGVCPPEEFTIRALQLISIATLEQRELLDYIFHDYVAAYAIGTQSEWGPRILREFIAGSAKA